MTQVTVQLENCYGIKTLGHTFDFSQSAAYAIYAPNGSMKTSFAQTFRDIADGQHSQDRIFPSRTTVRDIKDSNGEALSPERVLVLSPYDEFFSHNEKASTLLVNNALRRDYEKLHEDIDICKASFLKAMKEQSGSKKPLDQEIALAFMKSADEESFFQALERINVELKQQPDAPLQDVQYDAIFDDRILAALNTQELKAAIHEYILRYNQLLDSSTYFKKGIFEYYNATQIAKTLKDNGFFCAKHTVTLHAATKQEITTQTQLEELVQAELNGITNDKDLKKTFDVIKKQLEKNVSLRDFQAYLGKHEQLLPYLANPDLFKEQVWKSYFKAKESLYDELLDKYRNSKTKREQIEQEARKERTQWEAAIELFNERFFVPFKLAAKNKAAVALGHEPLLDLQYTFCDGSEEMPIERQELLKSLSQGEKKALYILNIIFEVEVRRHSNQETLFVIDDIADSFDYKNKYAIIQYLEDISTEPGFKQIILTHNFDFFRTLERRFVPYDSCLMATKTDSETTLAKAAGIRNPFLNWKNSLFHKGNKRVASIPFARNLVEYTRGDSDANYMKLTSLLHWKGDSCSITQADLDDVYRKVFGNSDTFVGDPKEHVIDRIEKEAKACLNGNGGSDLEAKVVLSMGIRLAAERFMVERIADVDFTSGITNNQTRELLQRFEGDFGSENEALSTLRKVALMTPENIHLNAFMYEPLLDMSDDSLRSLYSDVCNLK